MKIIANQSLLDIAIQENGSALTVLDWALANNVSITDPLIPGQNLTRPDNSEFNDIEISSYFKNKEKQIATISIDSVGIDVISQFFGGSLKQKVNSNKCIAIANQSLFDIAIQEDGTALTVLDWALANNVSITSKLSPGQILNRPKNSPFRESKRADYFKSVGRKITTASGQSELMDYLFPNVFPISL